MAGRKPNHRPRGNVYGAPDSNDLGYCYGAVFQLQPSAIRLKSEQWCECILPRAVLFCVSRIPKARRLPEQLPGRRRGRKRTLLLREQ